MTPDDLNEAEMIAAWLNGPIGRFVARVREDEKQKILDEFRKIDPTDIKAVTALQRKLHIVDESPKWLAQRVIEAERHDKIKQYEIDEVSHG